MLILIVDDEQMQREMLQGFLDKQGFNTLVASSGEEALNVIQHSPVELVITDHRMGGMDGTELVRRVRGVSPLIRSIMITAFGNVSTAVEVMQLGADDFLEKPVDLMVLLEKVKQIEQGVLNQQEANEVLDVVENISFPISVIGSSKPMQELLSIISRVAQTDWTALIYGETGTGKEIVARLLHLMGPRKDKPFIEVNCAAVPETLFESELFGHEKGSFTGATGRRKGRFELAHGGTLLLDEVGELPLSMQAKLLRALQDKKISRVGGGSEIAVDVRILAATNKDLRKMVSEGSFREDLYFRLNVLEIPCPPLRDRRDDIPELIDFFLDKYGLNKCVFSPEAKAQLVKYDFPGNVRELEHLIQRLVTFVRGGIIQLSDLPPLVREFSMGGGRLDDRLAAVEKEMIISALEQCEWVQTKAAESLGISERVLRYKMNKAGVKKG